MDEKIARLARMFHESENIVFFGGAGVSTASNIPDFRSSEGIFSKKLKAQLTPELLVSHTFYARYPEEFYQFYKENLLYPQAKPNDCHIALAKLERMGKLKAVVTQNIDGLHQAAGSKKVFELHGSVHRNYCMSCGKFFDVYYILNSKDGPLCDSCGEMVKPDVVLYEEGLNDETIQSSISHIAQADMLIIGGTSLAVYPAAGLVDYYRGKKLVLINNSTTPLDKRADLRIEGKIGEILSRIQL